MILVTVAFNILLSSSDYINDTKSVLDQIPRVLNSFMDIAALRHRADIVLCLITISQMIAQVSSFMLLFLTHIYTGVLSDDYY